MHRKFKLENNMAASERLQTLSEYKEEKENFPSEVSQLFTPGRKPLKTVQENLVGTPELNRSSKNRIARNSFTPTRLTTTNKTKRRSKRLSIPVHVFRRSLKGNKQLPSPLTFSSNLSKPRTVQANLQITRESKLPRRRSALPIQASKITNCNKVDVVALKSKGKANSHDNNLESFAEGFVNRVLNGILKEYEGVQQNEKQTNYTTSQCSQPKTENHIELKHEQSIEDKTAQHINLNSENKIQQTTVHQNQCTSEQQLKQRTEQDKQQSLSELTEKQTQQETSEQESSQHQNNEVYKLKLQEYTQIILQMNKERLHLEKQLSDYKKELGKTALPSAKMSLQSSNQKSKTSHTNKPELEKQLSKKNLEIQKLQKELQHIKTNKTSLEAKKEEARQLRVEINQLQHQVRELPGLKTEFQKSRQQVTHLNEVISACRRENSSQKSLVGKLEKELSTRETRAKQHVKDCEKLSQDLADREKEISRLQKLFLAGEEENWMYQQQCANLYPLVDRLEFVTGKAEKFKVTAQQKIMDLNHCLSEKTSLCDDLQEQLQSARNESSAYNQECAILQHRIADLTSEVDISHLEISRQQGVISSLEEQFEKLKAENYMYQDHLELIQCQHQEENIFLEEEKKALEETAREMEQELVCTKQKGQKVDELVQEVKFSRSMVMEKQEELDATQSQAHYIIQQLQNEITDAQEALNELWDTVGPLLNKFREQAKLDKQESVKDAQEKLCTSTPGKSLVQSVLTAAAQVNISHDDSQDDSIVTLCSQIEDLKQGLLELADIGHGQKASSEAQQTIKQLQEDRESIEQQYTTTINGLKTELETCRTSESTQTYTIQKQKTQIDNLTTALNNTRENLKQVNKENDAMNGLVEVEIEQRNQIWDLTDKLQRKELEYKRLMSEKECIDEQLREATSRMSEMSTTGNHDPGKLLEEKFTAERKLKELRDKWMEYRLKADDSLNEHKLTSNRKIRNLDVTVKEAENEIVRLDEILQKIRIVLRSNISLVNESPSLSKVLQFLNGGGNDKH